MAHIIITIQSNICLITAVIVYLLIFSNVGTWHMLIFKHLAYKMCLLPSFPYCTLVSRLDVQ